MALINYNEQADRLTDAGLKIKQNEWWQIQHPARVFIIGQTGTGKTTALMNLIMDDSPHKLNYTKIMLCVKDPTEKLYELLALKMHEKEEKIRKKMAKKGLQVDPNFKILEVYTDIDDLPPYDSIDKDEMTLIIWDDMVNEKDKAKLKKTADFFIASRKRNCTLFYLSQAYSKIDKIIRDQASYALVWKPASAKEVINLHQGYGGDLSAAEFKQLLYGCADREPGFMFVDLRNPDRGMRYRSGFTGMTVWSE